MISKKAIEKYIQEQGANWDWLKEVPREVLEEEIKALIHPLPTSTSLHKHQLECFVIGYHNDTFLYFLDMGGGKSLILLLLISCKKQQGKFKRGLVVVPYEVSMQGWETEVEKHSRLTIKKIVGKNREEKLERLKKSEGEDLVVVPYPTLTSLLTTKVKGKRWTPNYEIINEVGKNIDALILDESHLVKSTDTLRFPILSTLSSHCQIRYALTGTPFGRDAEGLWSQFYLVDGGETLGDAEGFFREVFFNAKVNRWGGVDYELNKKREEVLHAKLKNKSIRYTEKEFTGLPEKMVIKKEFQLTEEQKKYYYKVIEKVIEEGDKEKRTNTFVTLRMITSGYLYIKDKGMGTREYEAIEFTRNPKLEMLEEIVGGVGDDEKVVVFYEYNKTGDIVCRKLEELGYKYVRLYSATKDKEGTIKEFLNNKRCKVLVVNNNSGSVGLNLQVCRYQVYFESSVSPIVRAQADKRLHRTGQERKVFIYDLVAKGTIDEKILEFLKEGKNLLDELLKDSEVML